VTLAVLFLYLLFVPLAIPRSLLPPPHQNHFFLSDSRTSNLFLKFRESNSFLSKSAIKTESQAIFGRSG